MSQTVILCNKNSKTVLQFKKLYKTSNRSGGSLESGDTIFNFDLGDFPLNPFINSTHIESTMRETVAWRYINRDVVPFASTIVVECVTVGSTTLYKAAALRGLSFYVFVFYSYVVSTLVLLPLSLIYGRYLISSLTLYLSPV